MRQIQSLACVLAFSLFILGGRSSFSPVSQAFGQNSEKSAPYEQLWQQVSQLLEVREYSSALELIADAEMDPEFKRFKGQLKVDRKDLQGLQRLASLVKERASKLKPGDPLKVGSTEYKVVRFVSDAQGDRLVLESSNSSTKSEKALAQLDPRSWIALAQPQLTTSAEDRYIVGMFQASVEHGDRKAARQALNLAAEDKSISVTHWTARIDDEVKALEDERNAKKAELDDRILGTWRLVIGDGKKERKLNITFRARGKTDLRTSTWRKTEDGKYVLSFPTGGTARFILVQNDEKIKGDMANGEPVRGSRQAKDKR